MLGAGDSLDIGALRARYLSRDLRPADIVTGIFERIADRGDDEVWIHLLPREEVEARAESLENEDPAELPLYGIPFAIKDNIDVAMHPTTAGCPAFTHTAEQTAQAVTSLLEAGAVLTAGAADQVRSPPSHRSLPCRERRCRSGDRVHA